MNKYGLEINDPANWRQALNIVQEISGDSPGYQYGYTEITSPIKLFGPVLATIIAAPAREDWRRGAYMRQEINLPFGGLFRTETDSLFCPVNKPKIHFVDEYSDGYVLSFAVPNHLPRVNIGVWEFTEELESAQEKDEKFELDRLYALIASLQLELESLLFSFESGP